MAIKHLAKAQWKQAINSNSHARAAKHLRQILRHRQAKSGRKYYKAAKTRKAASMLAQLHTGHCPLNAYLHRFKKALSPYCQCQCQRETVQHYILECKQYRDERKWLEQKAGHHNMKLRVILGNPKFINHVAKYVEMTKRMDRK